MSMLDDLNAEPRLRPGPLCVFQKVRNSEGEERFRDLMAVMLVENRTVTQKQAVLAKHGYDVHSGVIKRHTRHVLEGNDGCVRCRECLS